MKNLVVIAIVALLVVGTVIYLSQSSGDNIPLIVAPQSAVDVSTSPATTSTVDRTEKNVKIFELEATNYSYSVKEIRVQKGDTVRIKLTSKEGSHDWANDEFESRIMQLPEGKSGTVEFTVNRVGTFEYYCSIGSHRQNGMVGKLIVE